MKTIKIKTEELVDTMQRAGYSIKDSIYLQVKTKKANEERNFAAITTCDGKTQSSVPFTCTCNVNEVVGLNLGKEFKEVVSTLASSGDEFVLDVYDTYVMVSCGTSQVPVSIKSEVACITVNKPNAETLVLTLHSEDFSRSIYTGGYAYTESGKKAALTNVIALMPYKDGEDVTLRIMSLNADGHVLAGSRCAVEQVQSTEAVENAINDKKVALLNGPFLMKLLKSVRYETLQLYITDNQASIIDGHDCFVMTLRDSKSYPKQTFDALFGEVQKEFSFSVDKKQLKTAASVAILNAASDKAKTLIVCKFSNGKLCVSSYDGKNVTELVTKDAVGEVTFGFNIIYLKEFLDHSNESVTFYGISNCEPIYGVGTEESVSMLLPVRVNLIEQEEEEETEETSKKTKKTEKTKKPEKKKEESKEETEEE